MKLRKLTEIMARRTSNYSSYIILPRKWVKRVMKHPTKREFELEVFTRGKDLLLRPIAEDEE